MNDQPLHPKEIYRVLPDAMISLADWDPRETRLALGSKDETREATNALNAHLEVLQELLYAENKHRILVVLQGMDTSGKDGTIRHVFEGVNPQGVRVISFKAPTTRELDHDFLWRIHQHTPGKGQITIFNRSHYEDILVVRVRNLVPREVWEKRYAHINAFEKTLVDEGTTILKFFLHISPEEQKERLQARLDDPTKHWKFNPADLKERKLWPDYIRAYEAVLSTTSTAWAPWFIIPADRKWYRNYLIASILVDTLKGLDMRYPQPVDDISGIVIE
jgi:PPK2 family polyphosphate:nucleotide phosphotransferase